jgi:hypothetical protein
MVIIKNKTEVRSKYVRPVHKTDCGPMALEISKMIFTVR